MSLLLDFVENSSLLEPSQQEVSPETYVLISQI